MHSRVVFRPIVGIIEFSWSPVETKLFLAFTIAEPMEAHIHGFRSFWLYFSIDNAICHRIVRLQWSGRLFVSHLFKNDANVDGLACHDVEACEFSFGG